MKGPTSFADILSQKLRTTEENRFGSPHNDPLDSCNTESYVDFFLLIDTKNDPLKVNLKHYLTGAQFSPKRPRAEHADQQGAFSKTNKKEEQQPRLDERSLSPTLREAKQRLVRLGAEAMKSPGLDLSFLKATYRELAKIWHPDHNPSPKACEQFLQLKQDIDLLKEALLALPKD
jgi:hypothetical protein